MDAPLRVRAPRRTNVPAPAPAEAPAPDTLPNYLERLTKLIPGEVIALYLVGAGIVPSDAPPYVLALWATGCLVVLVLVRGRFSAAPNSGIGPQWAAIAIAAVSFVIWLYAIGGPFAAYHIAIGYVASLLVLLWTTVVPYFYKGSA